MARNLENNLVRLLLCGAFLVVAYFGIQLGANVYSNKLFTQFSASARAMDDSFRDQIAVETDAYKAAKMGLNFAQAQKDELALAAYHKATTLDPGYRDGWVLLGQSQLKLNQPAEALTSLKKAEEIDPINPRTYELLALAYRANGNEEEAKKAEEKYQYLTRSKGD